MRIAICDDELLYLKAAESFVDSWRIKSPDRQAVLVQVFHSSEDLLEEWNRGTSFYVVFLDIQIPGEMSGLEVARKIRERNSQTVIVFITNYSEYVYSGYEVDALRYLRKPFSAEQIEECLDIAFRRWRLIQDQMLVICVNKETVLVPYREIMYIEVQGHYTNIQSVLGNEFRFRSTISEITKKLPEELFVLCHRSFVVNLMYIRKLKKSSITLSNGCEIAIGIKQKQNVENRFMTYYQGLIT